jgi:hypothetical protein
LASHCQISDEGVADGVALGVEDTPAEVRHLADGRRDGVVDDQQVVVGVQRQLVGVERPLGLLRGAHQFVGEGARRGQEDAAGCGQPAQEAPAGRVRIEQSHRENLLTGWVGQPEPAQRHAAPQVQE